MSTNRFANINFPINAGLQSTPAKYVPDFEFGIKGRPVYDYYWIYVVGCIAGFAMAFGIGANDVANSFATSVGSRTLKMWQAIIIAGLCEFFGAYLLGARVTSTIKDGIVNASAFKGHDDLFMFGMLCALIVTAIWLIAATWAEMPVSTTHSIIGAVVGFGLASPGGGSAVSWDGVGLVVASWFVSPAMSGTIAAILFVLVRHFILRTGDRAYDRTFLFFPILVFITFTINVVFILKKGGIGKGQGFAAGSSFDDGTMIGIAFGVGAGCALLTIVLLNPLMRHQIGKMSDEDIKSRYMEVTGLAVEGANGQQVAAVEDESAKDASKPALEWTKPVPTTFGGKVEAKVDWLFSQDTIDRHHATADKVSSIRSNAELFPIKAEIAFGYLQVFTACFASFAHGANDVANAIGPLAGIVAVYNEGVGGAGSKAPVPDWLLVLGGLGLVLGLAVYGHVIIAAMGIKLAKITPSRGFCMELSTAFVIAFGSFLGIPLSSTQVAVGSIVGVGLTERNWSGAVNGKLLARIFAGWVATIFIAGLFTALVYSFATFAPSQVYPLSAHNCIAYYGKVKNTTKGDPSTYTQQVDRQGTIAGIFAYPVDGSISYSL
ncbi:hypothetical protein BASA81_001618 [Batrachochytrium salamandrivorans]|nr:hypothetical protein BASA81_001618 [Batrachochytrium salamandrivorans]